VGLHLREAAIDLDLQLHHVAALGGASSAVLSFNHWVASIGIFNDVGFSVLRYQQSWIDQLRWQQLKPMEKLGRMLLNMWRES